MSDDVGQRVSSEAGGQEREALERLRSYLAVAPIGSLFDRSTQMLLRDVLAALDAERSRAEQWERDAKTNGEMYQGEYERHQQTKACIRELEEALTWISDPSYTGNYDVYEIVEIHRKWAKAALSQATKREGRVKCCGRMDNCVRDALPGSDYCGPCQEARATKRET